MMLGLAPFIVAFMDNQQVKKASKRQKLTEDIKKLDSFLGLLNSAEEQKKIDTIKHSLSNDSL